MRFLIGLVALSLSASTALAASSLKTGGNPFFANGDRSFLSHSALGPVCSTIRAIRLEPACNPALLGESDEQLVEGVFGANIFFGNDYDTLYKNRELIDGGDKMKLAENLMSEPEPVRFEGSTMLWWRNEIAAISFQPRRWTYYSDVRNKSYPDLSVHAMQEQSLQGQVGGFVNENLRLGVQLRFLDRKFVHEEFNVFTALPTIEEQFRVRNQRAVFIEPGIAYELTPRYDEDDWRPLLSLNMSQSGWVDRSYDDVPVRPIFDAGFSFSPPTEYGEWELGINYRWTSEISLERKFRIGTIYSLGPFDLLAGYDPDQWDAGLAATFRIFTLGLMHKETRLETFGGNIERDQARYLELRMVF